MKKAKLAAAAILAAAVAAAPARALTLQFLDRCDAILIEGNDGRRIEAQWIHYDCASNIDMTAGLIARGLIPNACPGGNGNAIIACLTRDACGGIAGRDVFWVLDSLDGTLDENLGDPFGEHSCSVDELRYIVNGF